MVFKSIITTITALLHCNSYGFHYTKGGYKIQEEKKYYNQQDIANEINHRTGCSNNEIIRILNSLGDVVRDKFSDMDNFVEIKLFPGLKVTSRYIPPEQSKSNLSINNLDYVLSLSSNFTDDFRKKVRELHNSR